MSFDTDHIETISLLQAMYPLPEEFTLSPNTAHFLEEQENNPPQSFELTLRLSLEDHPDKLVELCISLSNTDGKASINPRQPDWLNRTAHQTLSDSLVSQLEAVSPSEYILDTIESVKQTAGDLYAESLAQESVNNPKEVDQPEDDGSLERVWFWFPMLSTREKRKDLVDYAPRYNLTGFVLAGQYSSPAPYSTRFVSQLIIGKPALLCLEGNGRAVERYMSDIKSNSWGDIPSFQKKVTERFRRPITMQERKFDKMSDITNTVNYYGQYNHRGDMGQVRLLMEQWGVGEDFGAAVMNNTT